MGCLSCLSRSKSFHVKIVLLDKQELIQEIAEKTTGQDLLDNIFKYLNLIETAYFGLRYQDSSNQTHWIDTTKRVSSQIRGIVPLSLYLGVKFYAADPSRLIEEITRYQFFLQVKDDILQGRLPVSQELGVELAALAIQSELGDYDPNRHSPGYVSEFRYFATQTEEMEAEIETVHASMAGLGVTPANAEMTFLEKVKWLDMYGVDLHPVIGEDSIEYFLGLTPSGIIVLRNRTKVGNYFWPRITKIYFKGKYFMLRVRDKNNEDGTYGFETPSRQACKHLWKCCVEHHAFFRLVQVTPSHGGSGVFSLGSRFRYSGETEKQAVQQVQTIRRPQPEFTRRPSKRYSRRSSSGRDNESRTQYNVQDNNNSNIWQSSRTHELSNGSLKRPASSAANYKYNNRAVSATNSLPRHISIVSATDGPTRGDQPPESLQDLSLQSLQWLESKGGSTNHHRRSSLSEQLQLHNQRRSSRKLSSMTGQSDNESDASGVSWASGVASNRRRAESGSESEKSVRRTHRSRRKRHGSYKLIESEEQWQAIQQRQHKPRAHSSHGPSDQVNIQEATVRKSGYVNSGAETETEMASIASNVRRNRRRQRSRSRSPGESRARLPQEVVKHLEFGLVEPTVESLRGEIPFTNVQTSMARPVMTRLHQQARRSSANPPISETSSERRGPRTVPNVFPANHAIATMPRRHQPSTPSGSPRTTVSELSGLDSNTRTTNSSDLRERLGHNSVNGRQQFPNSSTPMSNAAESRQTPNNYNNATVGSYSPQSNRLPQYIQNQYLHQQQPMQQQQQEENLARSFAQYQQRLGVPLNHGDTYRSPYLAGHQNGFSNNYNRRFEDDDLPLPPPPPLPPGVGDVRNGGSYLSEPQSQKFGQQFGFPITTPSNHGNNYTNESTSFKVPSYQSYQQQIPNHGYQMNLTTAHEMSTEL